MPKGGYLSEFEQHVLAAVLRLRGQGYGVPIRREIAERTGRDVAIGSVYAALDRLERKGFVSSRVGEATPERGGRAKKYFDIEAPGERALEEAWRMSDALRQGIRADLDSLTETEIAHDDKRFLVRSSPRPAASLALRAAGVAPEIHD